MIALDTNVLVYAHRADSTWHLKARSVVEELANGRAQWCIPWPCIFEFFGVVTRARAYNPPTPTETARTQITALLGNASLQLIAEDVGFWPVLETVLAESQVAGAAVHDARIAALCIHHGVTTLYSTDRDFSRFPRLKTVNPLI